MINSLLFDCLPVKHPSFWQNATNFFATRCSLHELYSKMAKYSIVFCHVPLFISSKDMIEKLDIPVDIRNNDRRYSIIHAYVVK